MKAPPASIQPSTSFALLPGGSLLLEHSTWLWGYCRRPQGLSQPHLGPHAIWQSSCLSPAGGSLHLHSEAISPLSRIGTFFSKWLLLGPATSLWEVGPLVQKEGTNFFLFSEVSLSTYNNILNLLFNIYNMLLPAQGLLTAQMQPLTVPGALGSQHGTPTQPWPSLCLWPDPCQGRCNYWVETVGRQQRACPRETWPLVNRGAQLLVHALLSHQTHLQNTKSKGEILRILRWRP